MIRVSDEAWFKISDYFPIWIHSIYKFGKTDESHLINYHLHSINALVCFFKDLQLTMRLLELFQGAAIQELKLATVDYYVRGPFIREVVMTSGLINACLESVNEFLQRDLH